MLLTQDSKYLTLNYTLIAALVLSLGDLKSSPTMELAA